MPKGVAGHLTSGIRPYILDPMDTPQPASPDDSLTGIAANEKRFYDGHYRNTGKKTTMKTFRVYAEDAQALKEGYEGNASLVIRIMLEMFFKGELPSVEAKFNQTIKS